MKLTKKLEAELMQVYETWWNSYLTGDVETYHSFLDDDYHFVGSTNGEEYLNRKDTTAFFEKTADQLAGKAELRNTKRTIEELDGGLILITDLADAFVISEPEWVFYSRFRFTSLLRNTQNGWRFIYQHFSAPDTKAQEGETLGTEQITKENQELRDAIKRRTNELEIKNRELAIEAALERVRSKAMSMRKPDDLLTISKIVFTGLQSLGFNALRNALIHSYVDKENYFIDYDYSDFTGGVLSKIPYTGSPVIEKFISDIRKSRDAFSAIEISGSQLIEWKAFRLANNENIDPRLENIDALYYYFYSVGACSIGISTYKAISPEDLKLLERFRNVFNLSYQRYADIAKAEEQAREAKIEAALERIRSKSLAMYKTDDLSGVVSVLFEQMQGLSIDMGFASVSIFIFEEGSRNMNQWIQLPDGVASLRVPYFEHPISSDLFGAKERGAEYFSKVYSVEEKNTWAEKGFELTDYKNLPEEFKTSLLESPGYAISITLARNSGICIPSFVGSFPSAEDVEIMKRAGKVFEQAYTRFLDLQKAEAQAREAKIETALERVRSRSLAMHKSDELNEVVSILFEKLKELQIPATAVGIGIYIDSSKDLDGYVCGENQDGLVITNYRLTYFNHKIWDDIINNRQKKLDFFVGRYSKEQKNSFYEYLFEHTPELRHLPNDIRSMVFESPSFTITMVAVNNAMFFINDFEGKVLSGNEVDIIKRFARVFDQAYTRFLDLQKAEAQAREAQIEIAVERIRAKALAMHKSEEILNVAVSLREEMVKLNLQGVVAATIFLEQANGNYRLWDLTEMTDIEDGARLSLDIDFNPDTIDSDLFFLKFLRSTEKYLIVETNKADFERWAAWYRHYDAAGADKFLQYLQTTSITQSWHAAVPLEKGRLKVDFTNPPPKEMEIILPKMAAAFDLAYTRFLDIQKAEAQTREAQIETAVERVRTQSMAMYKTSDLYKVNEEILSQLNKLKVDGLTGVSIYLVDENDVVKVWDLSSPGNISIPSNYTIKYDAKKYPVLGGWVEKWKTSNDDYFVLDFPKEVLIRAVEEFKEILPEMAVHIKNAIESGKLQHQWNPSGRLSDGLLAIDLIMPPTEDTKSIVTKMAGAFNLAYQRFQDLQKAEAQAREAQIEAALERVRASAMAMHKSEELRDVIQVIHNQLVQLGFDISNSGIMLDYRVNDDFNLWMADSYEEFPVKILIPYVDHPQFNSYKEAKKRGLELFTNTLTFEEKNKWFQHVYQNISGVAEETKNVVFSYPGMATSCVYLKSVALYLLNYAGTPYSDSDNAILMRFGKVVDQAYTRFLDLQKAEAQAREAEIELALERVRSQAMSMQKSSDLLDIVVTMRNEFTRLGHEAHYFWHMMWLHEKYEKAMTSGDGSKIGMVMELPRHIHGDIKLLADWEKSKEPTVVYAMDAEAAVDYVDKMINLGDFKQVDPNAPSHDDIRHIGGLTFVMARTTHGEIGYSLPGVVKNPPKEDLDILVRFAGAFDIAHRRFLDLKKSEAQAREVQIELALEKVRSRSMGMQKSEELKEVIQVVYDEFVQLNIHIEHTGFIIDYKANDDMHIWLADQHEVPTEVTLPYFDCAHWNSFIEAKEKGKDFFANHLEYEEKNKFYRDLFDLIPGVPEEALEYYFKAPGLAISTVLLDNVGLYIENFTGTPYTEDENKILMRFGKVFQQTYTRFLDLKKAEAQAREAKIEGALERVRSRTMAMQRSDELLDVASVLFQQVKALGVPQWNCGFNIWDIGDKEFTYYPGSPDGKIFPSPCKIPLTEHPVFMRFDASRKRGEELLVYEKEGEEQTDHYQYMLSLPGVGDLLKSMLDAGFQLPTFQIDHLANFAYGNLIFITYEHFPEMHDVFKRFARVFEQTYTRFLDLKKAEAQAREGQIELGLERVRARAMAMQQSDELKELIGTVYAELTKLNISLDRYLIWIMNSEDLSTKLWMANAGSSPVSFYVPYHENPPYLAFLKGWKEKNTKWEYNLEGKIKKEWDEFVFSNTEMRHLPDPVKKGMQASERIIMAGSFQKFGCLQTAGPVPLTEEQSEVLNRFAKVFDSTYTRFNDLKKAEAQAREAKIEAALEKVRSRSLAMHTTNELGEVVKVIVEKLTDLGVVLDSNGVIICTYFQDTKDVLHWIASPDFSFTGSYLLPYFEHPIFRDAWQSRLSGVAYFSKAYSKEEKNSFWEYAFEHSDYKNFPDDFKQWIFQNDKHVLSFAWQKNSAILIPSHTGITPSESEQQILIRFAKVFEQAYTRFLDLQKAEAQARESRIEAVLERVRSRTMAMQKSDELTDVAGLLFEQVSALGIKTWTAGFNVWSEDNNSYVDYITSPQGGFIEPYTVLTETAEALRDISNARKSGVEFDVQYVEGEKIKQLYLALTKLDEKQYEIMLQDGVRFPSHQYEHFVFGSKVSLMFITYEPVPEAHDIFKRLGKVFEQTYTRFLDLQKAEAQAREAKIEASLERVRSKAMAMHNSQDLADTIGVFYKELHSYSMTPRRCGVGLLNKENKTGEIFTWNTTEQGESLELVGKIKMEGHPVLENVYNGWLLQTDYYPVLRGNEIKEYYQIIRPMMAFPDYHHDVVQYGYFFFFREGGVYAWTEKEMKEDELRIYRRFTTVLSLTYKRYKDLQQAEANAREAQIEAGLEKVRSRTLAMLKSDELAETSIVIFEQLINLGIEPNRLFIGIIKEKTHSIEAWATNEDGTKIDNHFTLNTDKNVSVKKMYEGWKNKKSTLTIDMTGKELQNYFQYIANEMQIPFKDGLSQKRRVQTIAYFGQGLIGMASPDVQPLETVLLLERFAAVFNLTYTRFNDLKIAEAQALRAEQDLVLLQTEKKKAEDALANLQAAQRQLVQSEKMASLGELTAGIAHEIQNPLNFVNNFSEVSKELLDEMKLEMEKGNLEDAKEIMKDVIQNLEKINHHGKRADGIVKGMLQHSQSSTGKKEPTDINALCDEYLRLSYHGLRAKDKSFNATLITDFDNSLSADEAGIGNINVIPQDIGRVILNLINNAFYAVNEKYKRCQAEPVEASLNYEPTVSVSTKKIQDKVEIKVIDNGNGIPGAVKEKIFQPFFTTKPTGQGTGLGLSLSYDIVKAHGGEMKVETREGEGSEFIIQLPVR